MKLAILSDIHSNLSALTSVLADIQEKGVDEIVCLGDVVGYGANPRQCLKLIKKFCSIVLKGNHEGMLLSPVERFIANYMAVKAVEHAQKEISSENKDYLSNLPITSTVDNGKIALGHGSYSQKDYWKYVLDKYGAVSELRELPPEVRVCFLGHTHRPFVYGKKRGMLPSLNKEISLSEKEKFVINVGSVGQPRDGDPRSCYGLVDTEKYKFNFIRVEYDIDKAAEEIRKAKLPERLYQRLYIGA